MRSLIIAAALGCAACASVSDIRQKPVAATFKSSRSVAEISTCLSALLSQPKGALFRTEAIEGGVLLAESTPIHAGSTVSQVTEILDGGEARTVTVRSIARYKPSDVARISSAYAPCL